VHIKSILNHCNLSFI